MAAKAAWALRVLLNAIAFRVSATWIALNITVQAQRKRIQPTFAGFPAILRPGSSF
jgi:hypothetical protein